MDRQACFPKSSPHLGCVKGFLAYFVQSYLHEKSNTKHIQNPLCTSGHNVLFLNHQLQREVLVRANIYCTEC